MRVLFVNSAWPSSWGGGEKWTFEAAHWFASRGHAVTVVVRPASRLADKAARSGLRYIETPFGGDFDPLAIRRASRILRDVKPDAVMVNFNKEAWQFGIAARWRGLPVVARHGFPLLRGTVHHRLIARRVLSALVVNAASIRDRYRSLGFDVSRVPVIHNGVRPTEQQRGELRRRFGLSADDILIVAAGRLESQKRFDRIIDLAMTIAPRLPRVRFLIAGQGPLLDALQSQIHRHALANVVQLTGFVEDFAAVVGDADLFLLTSDDEGTPNVMLEAMAAGVPAVAFAVGSVPDVLHGELADNAVPAGDVVTMSQRVVWLLTHDDDHRRLKEAMRERARREFSLDASMVGFENLLAGLMKSPT